ncbi:uncharacterized protein LOC5520909 [Nematostella vectensis]|uniref:uncharacterized protein LOC5520909 n=1 Tax=Nematostella vectensis TaxID=45351 RepID=UPI00138FF463|nr:uncharacterized protein LOC5520909 [Nematostella vectensis]
MPSSAFTITLGVVLAVISVCLSSPAHGSTPGGDIEVEVGDGKMLKLKAVGCYKDNEDERALRIPYHNHRRQIDWSKYPDFTEVIRACAKEAYEKGFTSMFGVQFYGECWSDEQAAARFNMHRMSTDCDHGVGKKFTNFIYGICTCNF